MAVTDGTEDLAKRLYAVWRAREDVLNPAPDDGLLRSSGTYQFVPAGRGRPRPRWEHLDTLQQGVWRDVAVEAGRMLADAMGAR